jgi:hypothetical protein
MRAIIIICFWLSVNAPSSPVNGYFEGRWPLANVGVHSYITYYNISKYWGLFNFKQSLFCGSVRVVFFLTFKLEDDHISSHRWHSLLLYFRTRGSVASTFLSLSIYQQSEIHLMIEDGWEMYLIWSRFWYLCLKFVVRRRNWWTEY